MAARIALLAILLFSPFALRQEPTTVTHINQVYTKGSLIREITFNLVNGKQLFSSKTTNQTLLVLPKDGGNSETALPVFLVISGVGRTSDGRAFDFGYFSDTESPVGIVAPFEGFVNSGYIKTTLQTGHSYTFFGWMETDRTLKIHQHREEFSTVLSGSFTFSIYNAVSSKTTVIGKKLALELVDAHAFNDPTQNVSLGPMDGFPISAPSDAELKRFATGQPVVSKVAADGVSLLLVRTELPEAGSVALQVEGAGTLYRITDDPFATAGVSSIQVKSRPVALPAGKRDYAFARYRPPSMLIDNKTSNFTIGATFKPSVETAPAGSGEVSGTLVRPPVVLVHGTYDNPKECWQTVDADDAPQTMNQRLTQAGFRVFCVDWEKTNGRVDPSDFATNTMTVLNNKDGILDALATFRKEGIAVTQVDIVAHSQGGVITRVFARGRNDTLIDTTHEHFNNKQACRAHSCWYHTKRNFGQGDIRRFITISTTHRGSDVPGLFRGITAVRDKSPADGATSKVFTNFVDAMQYWMTGVKTGGFKDQMPGSAALRHLGPTPIKSHAIAIVCSDSIMETRKSAFYLGRLKEVWTAIPRFAIEPVFDAIGQKADGERLHEAAKKYADLGLTENWSEPYRDLLREFRRTVFRGEENDCVVAFSSSCGGLNGKHVSKIDGYVHSYSPRETAVQLRVVDLLSGSEDPFDARGFPDTYDGKFVLPSSNTAVPSQDNSRKSAGDDPKKIVLPDANDQRKSALPPVVRDILMNAQALITQGKPAEAEYLVSKAIDENPKAAALWAAKSTLLASLRRLDGAIQAAEKAIDLEPQNADFRANLGLAYFASSDNRKAVDAYREAVRLAPTNGYYYGALGAGLIGLQRYKEAEAPLKEALKLTPTFALHHLYMGDCLSFQNRWADSMPYYLESVRLDPKLAGGHGGIGGVAISAGRYAEAEPALRKAVELAPYVSVYHANLAAVLSRRGKRDEALRFAQEAKRLGLKGHWVYQELGLPPN